MNGALTPRSNGFAILRRLMLAALAGQFLAGGALAAGGGSFALAPGETTSVVIGSTYREIRICNDLESADDLVVAVVDHDPFRLAPGNCKSEHGDHVTLRNVSASIVFCLIQVIGKHQS